MHRHDQSVYMEQEKFLGDVVTYVIRDVDLGILLTTLNEEYIIQKRPLLRWIHLFENQIGPYEHSGY